MDRHAQPSEMITVGEFNDIASASVARSKLEAAGIHCFLANEHIMRVQWLYAHAVGGLRLQVAQRDEAAARSLLAEPSVSEEELTSQALEWQPDDHYYKAERACPACGSTNIKEETVKKPFRLLGLLFYMPMPLEVKSCRCEICGHTWR